jgi:hypothetical protein
MFFDPTGLGKQYSEEMEKIFIKQFEDMIRNPSFLSQVGKVMGSGMEGKKIQDEALKSWMEKMNIPTRNDTAKILQYLQTIESRIIGLEEKLEDLEDKLMEKAEKESKPVESPAKRKKKPGSSKKSVS